VINHGRPGGATDKAARENRAKVKPYDCGLISFPFTSRNYVVAYPLRRGYGETGGPDREHSGPCNTPDYYRSANAAADDIEAAIKFLKTLPYVAKERTIVIGQSVGGLATIALAARRREGIVAHINFAGGQGGRRKNQPNNNCSPQELVSAVGRLGRSVRGPMLWIYSENDSYFGPNLARKMHAAFTASGGAAEFRMLPPFREDGHSLFSGPTGYGIWAPIVFRWLDALP
jgi:pimeloyl-ACP methyl ester carboxylesterase